MPRRYCIIKRFVDPKKLVETDQRKYFLKVMILQNDVKFVVTLLHPTFHTR